MSRTGEPSTGSQLHESRMRRIDCAECRVREEMVFARLNIDAAKGMLAPIRAAGLGGNEVLYRQGEPGSVLYSLRRGIVKLSMLSSDDSPYTVRMLGKGALIGLELLLQKSYQYTAATLTSVDVCRIPGHLILDLAVRQPVLYEDIMRQWNHQLATADTNLIAHSTGTIRQRVLTFLSGYSALCAHSDVFMPLPSNRDCANMVSATVESVSRVMADLKRAGVLVHRSNGFWDFHPSRAG